MKANFTDRTLLSIKKPKCGQLEIIDTVPPLAAVTGQLGNKVGKNTKTFFVQYRMDGKRRQCARIGKPYNP